MQLNVDILLQDVYSAVANMVRAQVAKDSNEPGAKRGKGSLAGRAAVKLQGQVDRKLVKQTVMTSVYGVTYIGARDQIEHRCATPSRTCLCQIP